MANRSVTRLVRLKSLKMTRVRRKEFFLVHYRRRCGGGQKNWHHRSRLPLYLGLPFQARQGGSPVVSHHLERKQH